MRVCAFSCVYVCLGVCLRALERVSMFCDLFVCFVCVSCVYVSVGACMYVFVRACMFCASMCVLERDCVFLCVCVRFRACMCVL